jgi:predicted amidophosphoribosyltransferase
MLALKHGGHDELAGPLGRRLAAMIAMTDWAHEVTAVAPVPSHGIRRLRRRSCAAEELARAVARSLDRPLIAALDRHGLRRQQGRTRAQRLRLPRGCMTARGIAAGHRMLVVDDVATTGTTMRRAAEALLDAGADAVFCAAMAHAPDPRRL